MRALFHLALERLHLVDFREAEILPVDKGLDSREEVAGESGIPSDMGGASRTDRDVLCRRLCHISVAMLQLEVRNHEEREMGQRGRCSRNNACGTDIVAAAGPRV